MARPEKKFMVGALKEELEGARGAVVTELRGMTVDEMVKLRRELRQAGGRYRVVKHSLASRAVAGGPYESLSAMFHGVTGVAMAEGEPLDLVKALAGFAKEHESLVVAGGVIDSETYSAERVGTCCAACAAGLVGTTGRDACEPAEPACRGAERAGTFGGHSPDTDRREEGWN